MYMMWFDDTAKRTTVEKIQQAVDAYRRHFNSSPNVVLVSAGDADVKVDGLTVRTETYIRRNNYWLGFEAVLGQPAKLAETKA